MTWLIVAALAVAVLMLAVRCRELRRKLVAAQYAADTWRDTANTFIDRADELERQLHEQRPSVEVRADGVRINGVEAE